jgi:hypothetical protein
MRRLLSTTAVARLLNMSESGVRSLDATLAPEITSTGRRVYDAARVEEYAKERKARLADKGPR